MARAGEGGARHAAAALAGAAFTAAGNNSAGARAARNCSGGVRSWTVKTLRPRPRPTCAPAPRPPTPPPLVHAPSPAAPRAAPLGAPRQKDGEISGLGNLRGKRRPPTPETGSWGVGGAGADFPERWVWRTGCRSPWTPSWWVGENPERVEPTAPLGSASPPRLPRCLTRTVEPLPGFGRGRVPSSGVGVSTCILLQRIPDRKPRYVELAKPRLRFSQ